MTQCDETWQYLWSNTRLEMSIGQKRREMVQRLLVRGEQARGFIHKREAGFTQLTIGLCGVYNLLSQRNNLKTKLSTSQWRTVLMACTLFMPGLLFCVQIVKSPWRLKYLCLPWPPLVIAKPWVNIKWKKETMLSKLVCENT